MIGWQWHQLDHTQLICTSLQTDNHTSTSPLTFYRLDAFPAAQLTASKHLRHIVTLISHNICRPGKKCSNNNGNYIQKGYACCQLCHDRRWNHHEFQQKMEGHPTLFHHQPVQHPGVPLADTAVNGRLHQTQHTTGWNYSPSATWQVVTNVWQESLVQNTHWNYSDCRYL